MKFMCLCWKSVKTTRSNKESRRVLLLHCVSIPFNSIFPTKHLCRGCLGRAVLFFRNNATSRSGTNGNMLALDTWRFECKKSTISQPAGLHVLQPTLGFGTFFSVRGSLATLPMGHLRPYPLKTKNRVTCDPTSFYCACHTKLHLVTCDPTHHY